MTAPAHPERLGRYEIVSALAHGGMAELFIARLPGIEGFAKRVVIKRVLPSLARDRDFVDMFLGEARLAATLDHQNIVQVHDIGHDTGGYFFAMELLHGDDVGHIMQAVVERGGLPIDIAVEIARSACAGLHYAHERAGPTGTPLGLVHRDISPQNLFVTFDGAVKLLDFGIAKAVQRISNQYTRSGTLRGKLPYMAPEQARSEPLDRRSDVFSLSIVLWEMTVGERLYSAEGDFEILKSIVEIDAPPPSSRKPGYPAALERIVMKGLQRDRSQRYQTADELQADLETFVREHGKWVSTRDMAGFMAGLFADRAASWRRTEREPTPVTRSGGDLVPFPIAPRVTVELPPRQEADFPEPPAAASSAPVTPSPSAPATTTTSAPIIATASAPVTRGKWIALAAAIGLLAITIGYVVGRAGRTPAAVSGSGSASASTSGSATTATTGPVKPPPVDAHWFEPDDVLISTLVYRGARVDHLHVAKQLGRPARAGDAPKFLQANGDELDTSYYWKTRVASVNDLVFGRIAFCFADMGYHDAKPPVDRRASRMGSWMMGRITDATGVERGVVVVANVSCDVRGVRVVDE